jgi:prepilin-type processing-associated H-X9-DG protein
MKFLVLEHERANDYVGASWPYNDKVTTWYVGDDAVYPRWAGDNGNYSFRHGGKNTFRMNALFVDGHVEQLTEKDEINTQRRFNFSVW